MKDMKDFEKELRDCNLKLYEAELINKRKTEFIAHLSHEFKTPLNAINGFASLMAEQEYPREKQLQFLNNILTASKHLKEVVNYTIEEAKADTGNIKLYYEKFEPREVITEVVQVLGEKLKIKEIQITAQAEHGFITADKRRFRQMMYNLVGNAYKFNKNGGSIKISAYFEGEKFFFEIEDTGIGIDKNEQKHIFDFFSHLDSKKYKNEDGSGIGLSVCKKLITLHHGEINFESKPGKGSVFRFYLPKNCSIAGGDMVAP